jgi:hypothetical protein
MSKYRRPLMRLPIYRGSPRNKTATLSCFEHQKVELLKQAEAAGMSVSCYLNSLLFNDWMKPKRIK